MSTAVLLDLDGTLVDSVFHHVIAWDGAFRAAGYAVPLWRVHHAIGMGGERLVPWVLGRHVEESKVLRDDHRRRFLESADSLRPTRGAHELIEDLEARQVRYSVATSAEPDVRAALLGVLDLPDLSTSDAEDVGSSKPAPDLLLSAAAELDTPPERVSLVGDSPWDAVAAARVGMRSYAVRTGGFGDDRLRGYGAAEVVDDPGELVGRL